MLGRYYTGWGVSLGDGVLVYGMGGSFTRWAVNTRVEVLIHGMGC